MSTLYYLDLQLKVLLLFAWSFWYSCVVYQGAVCKRQGVSHENYP